MKKWLLALFALSLMLVLAACGEGEAEETTGDTAVEEITIEHELGEAVVAKNPEKVVVFDYGVLDTLDALEVEVAGVPQMSLPSYLEQYAGEEYENVGSLKEPDFEAIHAMDPDVIFISGRQADLYEQFNEIAPTVYTTIDTANYMDSFKSNMELIGNIFGKEAEVEEKVAAIDSRIDEVKAATDTEQEALITLTNEGKISAYGPASRFGIIHDVLGVKPVDDTLEVSTHGQSITSEYILEENPDVLFVIDRNAAVGGEAAAQETIENELVKKTDAYQNDQIIYLDPNYWYLSGGGLQSVSQMVEDVASAVQ